MKEQLISFARDVAVAFVGVGLALALLLPLVPSNNAPSGDGSAPQAQPTSSTNQKIQTDRLGQSLTVKSGGAFVAAAGSTVTIDTLAVTNLTSQTIGIDSSFMKVTAPTAATSATPAAIFNNLGAANDIAVFDKNGTPVVKVSNAGNVSAAQFAVAGTPVFWATPQTLFIQGTTKTFLECNTKSVTGAAAVTPVTTNATPVIAVTSLGVEITGDLNTVNSVIAGNVITLSVWNSALTPVAASGAGRVDYCIYGTTP